MISIHSFTHLLVFLCASLAGFILFLGVWNAWQWQVDWQLTHHQLQAETSVKIADESKIRIARLPTTHLFGNTNTMSGEVPTTNLELHVTGIVKALAPTGSSSKAYISIAGKPSKIYQIGDNLPYGVKIYNITSQAVIVDNNGHLEKILLPRQPLHFIDRKRKAL